MIYTVTFNPSLDYIVDVPSFELGMTNRTQAEQMFPGGKGINVSIVLQNLGHANKSLGFLAGFVGCEIEQQLHKLGVQTDFILLEQGISRINVKLKNVDGTEINGIGPVITTNEIALFYQQLEKLKEDDILILAGSIPASMPDTIYMDILEKMKQKNILIVVDATKELLLNVLSYRPFLIKPNHHELGEIFGVTLESKEEILFYANQLQQQGASNILVSMGARGAILLAEDGSDYFLNAPEGTLVNAVGAGDSMVAGFLAGWIEEKQYEHAFKLGVAAGSASAFSENLATKEEVMKLYKQI